MFTGTLKVTRDEAQRIVEELGGIAGSSVSRNTDYLVCGEDQVGKSGKWEKAGLLGVTRVDEEFFWNLVEEAKADKEPEDEVIVHLEEDQEITDEQWEVIFEKNPNIKIMTEEQFVRLLKVSAPSYENPDKLKRLVEEYKLDLLPPTTCKFCGSTIPYSIYKEGTYSTPPGMYFCFKCRQRSDSKEPHHSWFNPNIPGVKENLLMCRLCGDFIEMDIVSYKEHLKADENECYWRSAEYLVDLVEKERRRAEVEERVGKYLTIDHVCKYVIDKEKLSDEGVWLKCEVCGNSKFVSMDKFEEYSRKRESRH